MQFSTKPERKHCACSVLVNYLLHTSIYIKNTFFCKNDLTALKKAIWRASRVQMLIRNLKIAIRIWNRWIPFFVLYCVFRHRWHELHPWLTQKATYLSKAPICENWFRAKALQQYKLNNYQPFGIQNFQTFCHILPLHLAPPIYLSRYHIGEDAGEIFFS